MDKMKKRTSLLIRRISGQSDKDIPRALPSPGAASTASGGRTPKLLAKSPLFRKKTRDDDPSDDDDYFGAAAAAAAPDALLTVPGATPAVQRAARLPPRVTATHVFFFGAEAGRERVLAPWHAAPFEAPSAHGAGALWFQTAEHYTQYRKAVLMVRLCPGSGGRG